MFTWVELEVTIRRLMEEHDDINGGGTLGLGMIGGDANTFLFIPGSLALDPHSWFLVNWRRVILLVALFYFVEVPVSVAGIQFHTHPTVKKTAA